MDINYFKEFAVLAETRSYWRAAERLFIGQSTLSKHIKAMEEQLGAPLFARTSRKVELTEFGAVMLPYAREIARLQGEYEALAPAGGRRGTEILNIASIPAMAQYGITDAILGFQRAYPEVQVRTQEDDTVAIREWVLDGRCELAFMRESGGGTSQEEGRLEKIPFCRDELVAVLPAGHPLAGADHVELSQLAGEAFALIKQDSLPHTICLQACQGAGFTPRVVFTSHHIDGILDMVAKGYCVSLLFGRQAGLAGAAVRAVPILPAVETTVYLVHRRDRPLTPAAARFVERCAEGIHSK